MFAFVRHLFKLQFLLIIIAVLAGIYYERIIAYLLNTQTTDESIPVHYEAINNGDTVYTKAQLALNNGENGTPIYLALLGRVYDVSKGAKHYGNGCSYNFFVGRDASVSFVTGEFDEYDEATADDVVHLKPNELLSLDNWQRFYEKEYIYKGKVIGRFYDATGAPTAYQLKYLALLEQAQLMKTNTEKLRERYPDCNIEWSVETGSHVWCTNSSGGKERQWVGYPRKLFQIGSEEFRCACIREEELDTTEVMIKEYDNCEKHAHECYYKVD